MFASQQVLTLNALVFDQPILLRSKPTHRGREKIRSVEDGFALLFRSEVSEYRTDSNGLERSAWTEALYHLSTAKFERTPESIERARGAVDRLASACGISEFIVIKSAAKPKRSKLQLEALALAAINLRLVSVAVRRLSPPDRNWNWELASIQPAPSGHGQAQARLSVRPHMI
jgi:hypothetical protein